MMRSRWFCYPLIICFCLSGLNETPAQLSRWDYGGYVKNLLTYADGDIEGYPIEFGRWQNSSQLRFNTFYYPSDDLVASGQTRTLLIYQKDQKQVRQFQNELVTSSYYFDLKFEWLKGDDIYGFTEIDRLYLNWRRQDWEVILGRQRIAWGTCLVWNPTDLFNPFDILDFDYEERPGTDALQVQYYTGPLSQLNLSVTPGRTRYEVIYAGRYVANRWNYDVALIAGWQRNSLRLATNWAGQLFDGGFRGEILYTDPNMEYRTFNPAATSITDLYIDREVKDPFWTVALSYDYTFSNSFYIHTEYLYNGLGTTGKGGARRFDIIFTGELTPARQSIFQEFAYQLTPLLRGDFFIIFNPNDKSWLAAPSLQYSVATNWELYFLMFPSGGEVGTEYGGFPNQYFARVKYAF
jgi:hypothetical protein